MTSNARKGHVGGSKIGYPVPPVVTPLPVEAPQPGTPEPFWHPTTGRAETDAVQLPASPEELVQGRGTAKDGHSARLAQRPTRPAVPATNRAADTP